MKHFQNIGLILSDENSPEVREVVERTKRILDDNGCRYYEVDNLPYRSTAYPENVMQRLGACDLLIVFGGDGTFLGIARKVHALNVPLLGVNLGHLGFLVDLDQKAVRENLENILNGEYTRENRFLLSMRINEELMSLAMNDVVIHKTQLSRLIELDVNVNGEYLTSYRADGLIFSTPTGSTAYSLSTGGPIIYPTLPAILIAPICPHTFSHRPIVLPSSSAITIQHHPSMEKPVNVTCDGQELFTLKKEDRLSINSNEFDITLIHPLEYSFFSILKEKLSWGLQPSLQGR